LCLEGIYGVGKRLRHHDHTRPTTKWAIINPSVISLGEIPRIGKYNIKLSRFKCPSGDANLQKRGKKLWK
jgi:hypothetical protein